MRIVMMGTGPFAVPTFRWLVDSPHVVVRLLTRPAPRVKGKVKQVDNPMRDAAEALGIPVAAPESVNHATAHAELAACAADLFVVCDYGQILSSDTLALSRLGGINLHGSLLPKYRGAAPVHWAIYHGEQQTGVTVIHMSPRLDGGPILSQTVVAIRPDETQPELEQRLAEIGVALVEEALGQLATWDGTSSLGIPQDEAGVTKAPRLRKSDGEIDWSRSARDIANQIRAFQPWPGSHTWWLPPSDRDGGEKPALRVIVELARTVAAGDLLREGEESAVPGSILPTASDRPPLLVATGDGFLSIEQVRPAGKRSMPASEFLRGRPTTIGNRLGTPAQLR